ncbi:MAG: adenosylcobalamin-dependent ribonucleoside-diphosphate reductase [Nanoarchaeota archaeon]|nr:adenosylcobalamin-dependent ribonucleoside-diphosphate reductase [Nanoarchaeota archaeon]
MIGKVVDARVRTELSDVHVSINQMKVITDKYLKNDKTISAWLSRVARNVALADFLYDSSISEEEIFDGVKYAKIVNEFSGKSEFLLHEGLDDYAKRKINFSKFVNNLYGLMNKSKKVSKSLQSTEDVFYKMMANFEFLPNSPTLMNAGRDLQQLSACYVLPVNDSLEEIYESLTNMAMIHKSGGGTGFDFSSLRPRNDVVITTKGTSSGPITFMNLFDKSTDVIKQGGTRRGANMGILRYDHPDIFEFINCKKKEGSLENFNISVAVDKIFMDAVVNDKEYNLVNPRNNIVLKKVSARSVFEKIFENAWETGDPGIIFIDRINEKESNPTPQIGQIVSTNPCGEQPLLPFEACNLGSINLSKFIKKDHSDFDYSRVKTCVWNAVHFLDNVISINNYPLTKIERIVKMNRKIGLGVMGWAESLVMLGIPYDSDKALEKSSEIMCFINDEALKASESLAEQRGVFANYKNSIFDDASENFCGVKSMPRNATRTTIAPTGTIGVSAGLQGAGIEPFFGIAYIRYNAAGIDSLKKGNTPNESDTFFEVNPLFRRISQQYDFFGLKEDELWKKIDANHKSLMGIQEIPKHIQKLFPTAHDISPENHVKMQAAFQEHVDNAVSKTVNLKKSATKDDVKKVYLLAYELGCKGITIYRDGCKKFQILNAQESKVGKKKRDGGLEMSRYYKIDTGQGPLHIHINYDNLGPVRLFANLTPTGTEISGLTTVLGILTSKYFQLGGSPIDLLRHFNSIKGDKPIGFGPNRVDSIPHALSKALRVHLISTGKLKNVNGQTTIETSITPSNNGNGVMYCSKCFSPNVSMTAGCSEPTCFDCGYSKCS